MQLTSLLSFLALALPVFAKHGHHHHFGGGRHGHRPPPPMGVPSGNTTIYNSTFEQYLDHENPHLGTFSQRYWWSEQFYRGPGSPVVLFTPGEVSADGYQGYLTTKGIFGVFANETGGTVIILEHRYWGESSPYESLTTENLRYLTLKNSIADLTNFARNVKLPFDPSGKSNAPHAPWILSGGSYSGALAAWTSSTAPGTFWAYTATSAPVQAVYDMWTMFAPVQNGMPKNCSSDVSLVIDHVDKVLETGTAEEITELKAMFGLESVTHAPDFGAALENGPWSWQEDSFTTGYSEFYQWCDAVENVEAGAAVTPGPEGVGLTKALAGYASFVNSSIIPGYCQAYGYPDGPLNNTDCFDTYNPKNPMYTDLTVGNPYDRQWVWMLCNEPFAYWQDGAPAGTPSIVSRTVTAAYWQRQCDLFFPTSPNGFTYGSSSAHHPPLTVASTNAWTGGWNIPAKANKNTRLFWINGEFDTWRNTGVASVFRPGGPLPNTPNHPSQLIPGGVHCTDLHISNGVANPGTAAVQAAETAQIKTWVGEFYSTPQHQRRFM